MVTSLPCTYSTGGKERGLVSHGHVIALHVQHWGKRERACHCPARTALEERDVSHGHVIAPHVQHWGKRERACQSWSRPCPARTALGEKREGLSVMVTSLPCTYSTGGKERGLVSHGHVLAPHVQHWGKRERACQSWSRPCPARTALGEKREGLSVMVTSLPCTYSTGGKERGLVSHGHVIAPHVQHWGKRERACQSWSHHCPARTALGEKREGLSVMVTSLPCTYSTGGKERGLVSHGHVIALHVQHWGKRERACQSWSRHCPARTALGEKREGLSVMVTSLPRTYSTGGKERGLVSHGHVIALHVQHWGKRERACQSWSRHCPARTALGEKREGLSVMVTSLPCTYSTGGKERGLVSHGHVIALHVQHWGKRERACQSWSRHCPARTALGEKREGLSVMVTSLPRTYSTGGKSCQSWSCTYSTGGKEKGPDTHGHITAMHVQQWGGGGERRGLTDMVTSLPCTYSSGGGGGGGGGGERERACQSWLHHCHARTVLEEKREGLSVMVMSLSYTYSIRQEEMSVMVMSLSCTCSTGREEKGHGHVTVLHVQHWD